MKVVITGATGVIGRSLIDKCIDNKIYTLAICHRGSGRAETLPKSPYLTVEFLDLEEYALADIQGEYDLFYHLAWKATTGLGRNDMDAQYANIGYALDAVRLAKKLGCSTFIGAGSQAEYGRVEGMLREDTPAFPENGYGIAKLCAGQMTRILCEQLDMKHIWARVLSVYGPHDGAASLVSTVISKLLSGEKPSLTAGGQMWDYIYGMDAAEAFLLMGTKGVHGRVYPLGSGEVRPLKEYIQEIKDVTGSDAELGFGEIPYAPKQVMELWADISALKQDTGFSPKVSFREGIEMTVEWMRNKDK